MTSGNSLPYAALLALNTTASLGVNRRFPASTRRVRWHHFWQKYRPTLIRNS